MDRVAQLARARKKDTCSLFLGTQVPDAEEWVTSLHSGARGSRFESWHGPSSQQVYWRMLSQDVKLVVDGRAWLQQRLSWYTAITVNIGYIRSCCGANSNNLTPQSDQVVAPGCSAVGSAPALGAGCRRFKSCHSDLFPHSSAGRAPDC